MSRDIEILHSEICQKLDRIIQLLEQERWNYNGMPITGNYSSPQRQCVCDGSMNTAGVCMRCGLFKR